MSAIVFSRAKQLKFFEGLDHLDLDLLKTVKEFVEGFEVAARASLAVGGRHSRWLPRLPCAARRWRWHA